MGTFTSIKKLSEARKDEVYYLIFSVDYISLFDFFVLTILIFVLVNFTTIT
jgi:hypothetical protein